MDSIDAWADLLLTRLLWTSLQACIVALVIYLAGRVLRGIPAAVRCHLWWLLSLQLLLGLAVPAPFELPLLAPPAVTVAADAPVLVSADTDARPAATTTAIRLDQAPASASGWHWQTALVALWALLVGMQLLVAVHQWRRLHRTLRGSRRVDDVLLLAIARRQAARMGLRRLPDLRISDLAQSPHVVSLWRPVVLLPAAGTLDTDDLAMALSHEFAHVRRGDLWLGWLPALTQRLFFFHPLVALATNEYAFSREAACDAHVMDRNENAPDRYGRLLLRLGVGTPMGSGLASASSTFTHLKRRLIMLQNPSASTRQRAFGWMLVTLVACAGVVPYRVTARAADPAKTGAIATVPPAPPAPPAAPAPPAPPVPLPEVPPPPPPPPPPPVPPVPPVAPPSAPGYSSISMSSPDDGLAYAVLDAGHTMMVSGTQADIQAAYRVRQADATVIWVRRGKQSYVIRDPASIKQMQAALEPARALGARQSELGTEQAKLGGRQALLGGQQARLGSRQAQLAMKPDSGDYRAAMAELATEQAALARQQEPLGEQQRVLGERQAQLGKLQAEVTVKVRQSVLAVLDGAIRSGTAQPEG
jgi:bla regulator protein BlaR1